MVPSDHQEDTENAVAELDTEIEQTKQALDRLAKYVGDKKAMFVPKRTVTVDEFAGMAHEQSQCRQIVYDILRLKREQQELQNEKNKILNLRATLEPWQALPVPLDFAGTKYTRVMLGMLPLSANLSRIQEDLETQVPASHLAVIASDKYQHYSMLVCHRQCQADAEAVLRKHGFAPASFGELSGTVAANIQRANEEAAALERAFQEKKRLSQHMLPTRQNWSFTTTISLGREKAAGFDQPCRRRKCFPHRWVGAESCKRRAKANTDPGFYLHCRDQGSSR